RHTASPAAFAPLTVSGQTQGQGDSVDLTALITGPGGLELADVAASHDPATGSGEAEVKLRDLRFVPGGLQPAALSPLLAAFSEARGAVAGAAALSWDEDGLGGGADLVIEGLSFAGQDLTVSGLDLSLTLDSLQPPASPPHQVLRADTIDPGVPLKDLEVKFRLPPEAPGQILIEDASFSTVGSRFALHDTLLNPAAERLETQLQVDQMDVAVLFDLLAVEGLSGSGELSGSIPIRRDGDVVTVSNARLEALGPGVLRFRSDAARRALAGGGEYVALAIQALEDFRYETLILTGNLDRDGETAMRLEILGHNPEVLEGHPFQLNINLTGNSTQILEAMVLSRALLKEILSRARRLSR
ncbi:MAG: YdbH domain-containing protein, partial [Kiloniellales bacterium]|nr:YdbH domain-containing protein [Kiloniellales bacterium]